MSIFSGPLIAVGDSITTGVGAAFAYGDYIKSDLGLPTLYNLGLSGAGWLHDSSGTLGGSTITARAAAEVDVHVAEIPQPFVILFAGTNDIYWGSTASQTLNAFEAYVQARLAAGWLARHLVVNTMISRGGIASADRAFYNTGMAALQPVYRYYIARLDLDPRIGPDGAYADTIYFGDGTHPTTAGQRVIADLDEAIVAAVMPLRFRVYA
jgi:lysophospholipase L1-like esterase